jgi:hypothetical protein
VRTGYADPDHRLIESEKEKVEFRLFRSALTGQDRLEKNERLSGLASTRRHPKMQAVRNRGALRAIQNVLS